MKLIEGLYIAFYRFSTYFKENIPGSFLGNQRFDSIATITLLFMLNLCSIWIIMGWPPLITTHAFDFFLGYILIATLNTLYFERKQRYKHLIEKHKDQSFFFLGLLYSAISIGLFVYVHSSL